MTNPKKILICDDDPGVLSALHDCLSDYGHLIISCANGRQAFEAITIHKPDVIISDIQMPELNGLELLQKLINNNIFIPVIFLTGHRSLDHIQKGFSLGHFDILHKPFEMREITNALSKAFAFAGTTGDYSNLLKNKNFIDIIRSKIGQ